MEMSDESQLSNTGLASNDLSDIPDTTPVATVSSMADEEGSDNGSAPMSISEASEPTSPILTTAAAAKGSPGTVIAPITQGNERGIAPPKEMQAAVEEDGVSADDRLYLELRYPTKPPFDLTTMEEDRMQDLTSKLGLVRINWLNDYAKAQNIVAAHERAKMIQPLIDEEIEEARVQYEKLGYDPLGGNLTAEQEEQDAKRCLDAAIEIFGPAVLGRP